MKTNAQLNVMNPHRLACAPGPLKVKKLEIQFRDDQHPGPQAITIARMRVAAQAPAQAVMVAASTLAP